MPKRGFVFAATGPVYVALARRAAKTVAAHCPGYPIDLFTDGEVIDPVFARIHKLKKSWQRPKMESLYRSRFRQTVYLDADLFVVADIRDIFETLAHYDLACAHDQTRNSALGTTFYTKPVPAAFPQFNSGVFGVAKSDATTRFLREWEEMVEKTRSGRDQPVLRETLFDSNLRVCTLPPEYNLHNFKLLRSWTSVNTAPRVIHHNWLHQHANGSGLPEIPSLEALLGKPLMRQLQKLLESDRYLHPANTVEVDAFCDIYPGKKLPNPHEPRGTANHPRDATYFLRDTSAGKWFSALKKLVAGRGK